MLICFVLVLVIIINYVGVSVVFFFQAEDGIRDLVRSRGLGDVYKRQILSNNYLNLCIAFLFFQGLFGHQPDC